MSLKGKTVIITGASRGIGRAIALRCARDGASVVIAAKSVSEGKLPGTIHSVAKEVEAHGGRSLAVATDVRDESQVAKLVEVAYQEFGRIDCLVNNAGAINVTPLSATQPKKIDLMLGINLRAALLCTHFCIPKLKEVGGGHILNLSPPLSLDPRWLKDHVVYTISKYGMSLATLGLAEELRDDHIAVNSLWPRMIIASAAIDWLLGEEGRKKSREPSIVADAAHAILTSETSITGNLFIDEDVLRARGVKDFSQYCSDPKVEPMLDLFVSD